MIEFKSLKKGFVSSYALGLLWIVALLGSARLLYWHIESTFKHFEVNSLSELMDLPYYVGSINSEMTVIFAYLGIIASLIISVVILISTLNTLFYGSREVNVLKTENKISYTEYSFPNNISTTTSQFDKVISVSFWQTIVDKMFNVGNVRIKFARLVNTNYETFSWKIPGVLNPQEVAKVFEDMIKNHEGVEVEILD